MFEPSPKLLSSRKGAGRSQLHVEKEGNTPPIKTTVLWICMPMCRYY